jgi:hypothetical protein
MNNTNNDDYIPPRFKSTNVDRFAPVLRKVLEGKQEIRFKNIEIGLNANTAICRVRDAALAVMRGFQFYPDIDADKLRDAWPLYKVDYDNFTREVTIVRHKSSQTVSNVEAIIELTIRVEEPEFEDYITHLAWLYGHNKFRGFVTILGMLNEDLKQRLAGEHNVYFRQLKPNEHIMN